MVGLEEFDQRIPGREAGNSGAIAVGKVHLGHSEDIAIECMQCSDGPDRETDMGDPRSPALRVGHQGALRMAVRAETSMR